MALDNKTREGIESMIRSHEVVLFMKGTPRAPQCGFSAAVVQCLDTVLDDYTTYDVLSLPAVREGIKAYSSWPTVPQLYVRGEFVGGCDIVRELYAEGKLGETVGTVRASAEAGRSGSSTKGVP